MPPRHTPVSIRSPGTPRSTTSVTHASTLSSRRRPDIDSACSGWSRPNSRSMRASWRSSPRGRSATSAAALSSSTITSPRRARRRTSKREPGSPRTRRAAPTLDRRHRGHDHQSAPREQQHHERCRPAPSPARLPGRDLVDPGQPALQRREGHAGVVRLELVEELVREERRGERNAEAVEEEGQAHEEPGGRARRPAEDDVGGDAGGFAAPDLEADAAGEAFEAAPGEEPDVVAGRGGRAGRSRTARARPASAGTSARSSARSSRSSLPGSGGRARRRAAARAAHVLEHVGGEHDVVARARPRRGCPDRGRRRRSVSVALAHAWVLLDVDAR